MIRRVSPLAVVLLAQVAVVGSCSSPREGPTSPSSSPAATSNGPPASAGHNLVYAAHLGMVVLLNAGLGGASGAASSAPSPMWGWTGQEWQVLDSSGPPARNLGGVTYDTRRQVIVMHGGSDVGGRVFGETWEWSGSWRQVAASGPGARDHTQLAFDADRGRAVLFGGGGQNPNDLAADTWEYDGAAWTRVAESGPPPRVHHAMHYDAGARRVTMVGGTSPATGALGDVWTWDGTRWSMSGSIGAPVSHARLTFNRALDSLMLAGGFPVTGFNFQSGRGSSWRSVSAGTAPSARYLTDLAYDERRNVVVLFGGGNATGLLADTWEFDGSSWRQVR